jgi:hypothetical protein
MSGLSYDSLRERIRVALDASGDEAADEAPLTSRPERFGNLFGSDPAAAPSGESVLDLRSTRLISGWGAIAGLVVGAFLGGSGGVPGVLAGAMLGTLVGSLTAISLLVAVAGGVATIGVPWTLVMSAALLILISWVVTL